MAGSETCLLIGPSIFPTAFGNICGRDSVLREPCSKGVQAGARRRRCAYRNTQDGAGRGHTGESLSQAQRHGNRPALSRWFWVLWFAPSQREAHGPCLPHQARQGLTQLWGGGGEDGVQHAGTTTSEGCWELERQLGRQGDRQAGTRPGPPGQMRSLPFARLPSQSRKASPAHGCS